MLWLRRWRFQHQCRVAPNEQPLFLTLVLSSGTTGCERWIRCGSTRPGTVRWCTAARPDAGLSCRTSGRMPDGTLRHDEGPPPVDLDHAHLVAAGSPGAVHGLARPGEDVFGPAARKSDGHRPGAHGDLDRARLAGADRRGGSRVQDVAVDGVTRRHATSLRLPGGRRGVSSVSACSIRSQQTIDSVASDISRHIGSPAWTPPTAFR